MDEDKSDIEKVSSREKRKYDVVCYDPHWAEMFLEESGRLASVFGETALAIEHVGSTSVPGMSGKPTLDILVLVKDVGVVSDFQQAMNDLGYAYMPEYLGAGTVLFAQESGGKRLVNVHVTMPRHPRAEEMLRFRKYLIEHPETVEEYAQVKLDLYSKYPDDYAAYRREKDEYLKKLNEKICS